MCTPQYAPHALLTEVEQNIVSASHIVMIEGIFLLFFFRYQQHLPLLLFILLCVFFPKHFLVGVLPPSSRHPFTFSSILLQSSLYHFLFVFSLIMILHFTDGERYFRNHASFGKDCKRKGKRKVKNKWQNTRALTFYSLQSSVQ